MQMAVTGYLYSGIDIILRGLPISHYCLFIQLIYCISLTFQWTNGVCVVSFILIFIPHYSWKPYLCSSSLSLFNYNIQEQSQWAGKRERDQKVAVHHPLCMCSKWVACESQLWQKSCTSEIHCYHISVKRTAGFSEILHCSSVSF